MRKISSSGTKEVTTLSHGYTASLPQLGGFAMTQLDRVLTSFACDQKKLHFLFAKLGCIPSESPGLFVVQFKDALSKN